MAAGSPGAAGVVSMERNEIPKRRGVSPTRRGVRRLLILMTFALGVADRWSDFLIWVGAARHLRMGDRCPGPQAPKT